MLFVVELELLSSHKAHNDVQRVRCWLLVVSLDLGAGGCINTIIGGGPESQLRSNGNEKCMHGVVMTRTKKRILIVFFICINKQERTK
jgi:hypothetical protein